MLDLAADSSMFMGDFGEPITLRNKQTDAERSITAVVNRETFQPIPGTNMTPSPRMTIAVPNSSVTGITSQELDNDIWSVLIPIEVGGEAIERRLGAMLQQDDGVLTIEVM